MKNHPSGTDHGKTGRPQIPAAVLKIQYGQAPQAACQEQKVPESRKSWPQGPEKSVHESQAGPQGQAQKELLCGLGRSHHRSRRLKKPPCRGSS